MSRRIRFILALALYAILAPVVAAQSPGVPTAPAVETQQRKYQAERDQVVKDGTARLFLPLLLERAEELAKKGENALNMGRLTQASEAYRQARWQLPYQTGQVPAHTARILGSLRLRHSHGITALAFSPDGRRLATAGGDRLVKVWDLDNGHELVAYAGHGDTAYVHHVAFTADGRNIVSAGSGKEIKVWDATTGKESLSLPVPDTVSALALSPDGKYLLAGTGSAHKADPNNPFPMAKTSPPALRIFELPSGKLRRTDTDFGEPLSAVVFNPAGSVVAVADQSGQVRLGQFPHMVDQVDLPFYWSAQDAPGSAFALAFSPDGQTLARCGIEDVKLYAMAPANAVKEAATVRHTLLNSNSSRQFSAAFSNDGKTFLTGGSDGLIRLWDTDTAQQTGVLRGHIGAVFALASQPGGTLLASASTGERQGSTGDYMVRLWDLGAITQVRDFAGHTAPVWMASFSPDGHAIVSAGADRALKIWDAGTGKVRLELAGNTAPVTAALYSPNGKVIASAGADKLVRLWDAATGLPLRTCEGHQAAITALDFSPDGKRVLSGGADRSVRLWDTATGKALFSIEPGAVVAAVAFSPDGQQCAIGTIDHAIGLYDAATGKLRQRWLAHADAVTCLAYSPDGHYLASGGADGAVQLWLTAAPGAVAVRIPGHAGIVSMVAFRKDNQHLVSGGSDRLVKLWKIEGNAGKEVQTFRGHRDWVTFVGFSRDGERIVSASVDKLVKVWEIASSDLPFASEHTSTVDTVAFSPDNKLLATGSADHTIKLWDRATGAEIATLTGHTKGVRSLAFAPDSKTLISSGAEATLRLWEVAPPREIPRSPAQLQSFGHMPGPSPYLFVDPSGKKLFVWVPPGENEARGRSDVDCYDLRQGTKLFSFVDDNRLVHSLAFSANGKLAATGTGAEDDSVRLYDLEKQGTMLPGGDRFFFKKEGEKKPVGIADLALAPDGTTLIVTSNDGEVAIADVAKKTVRRSFKAHDGKIMACITSADGKRFATLGQDNVLKLWDLESGRELRRWALGKPAAAPVVHSLAFATDDRQLATGNANTTIYLLDLP